MNPIQNLLLAILALLATALYPSLPAGAPFDSALFGEILKWLLTAVAGWNVKAASAKSSLPTVRQFLKLK